MSRRRWFTLSGFAVIPLLALGYDRLSTIHWVGGTDLEVEFIITDRRTGLPIDNASIFVRSEGGLSGERDETDFTLTTGVDGTVRRVCHECMCFGSRSGLRFTDTYVVHVPRWDFRVSAQGYDTSNFVFLDVPEYVRQVQRVGPRSAKLEVHQSLRPSVSEQ